MNHANLFLSASLMLSLYAGSALAQIKCKPTAPYDGSSQGAVHQVLLYTNLGYQQAVADLVDSNEISTTQNSFSFVEHNFCIRKGPRDNQYYQTCGEATARVEWQAGYGGLLEFGVIGDETATVTQVKAKFDDVKIEKGAVSAEGKILPEMSEPLCLGADGRADSVKARQNSIEISKLSINQVYVVRIVSSHFVGATVNDMTDDLMKIQILNVSDKGLELKYQVLNHRGNRK